MLIARAHSRARRMGISLTASNPFRVLGTHRNFRLFWVGQTISLVGSWMQAMALAWLALELTGSAFLVGLVAVSNSAPILLFSLHAGALVDRSNKLTLLRIMQTLLLVEATLLWLLTWSGHVTIGWILGLAFFGGTISAVEIPARQSLVLDFVGRERLREAIALNSAASTSRASPGLRSPRWSLRTSASRGVSRSTQSVFSPCLGACARFPARAGAR